MARSAKQRAARNLLRKSRPVFEFTKLPPDLQFLVLCYCDWIAIGTLIKGNPSIRNLCLQYPDTMIESALEEIPLPLANLLHVTSTLESVSDDGFDAGAMVEFLKQARSNQWQAGRPQLFIVKNDAVWRIQSIVSIYAEVEVAADIVAQAMSAATQVSLDYLVVPTPIVLSATEQMRMICALLVVRIYYQLRFECSLAAAFMRTLARWQMVQGSSIEAFVDSCIKKPRIALDSMIDKQYMRRESLSQKSSYLRDYIQAAATDVAMGHHAGQNAQSLRYSDAVKAEFTRRRQWTWEGSVSESEYPGWHPAGPLRSYGWEMCIPGLHGELRLQRIVLRCGVLFWDQNRLADWDLVDYRDVARLGRWAINLYKHKHYARSPQEEMRSRQVVEWTRSPVQVSFEEFLARQGKRRGDSDASGFVVHVV